MPGPAARGAVGMRDRLPQGERGGESGCGQDRQGQQAARTREQTCRCAPEQGVLSLGVPPRQPLER